MGGTVKNSGVRVVLGVPVERQGVSSDEAFWAFARIFQQGWPLITTLYGRNDIQRQAIAEEFMAQEQFTHVCMLDSDHKHPVNAVQQLAKWAAQDRDKLVIGGWHHRRGEPYEAMAFLEDGDGVYALEEWPHDSIIPVWGVGFGSVLIAREALERIPPPWFKYEYPGPYHKGWPGPDMYFCKQCREHGIQVWAATGATSPHQSILWVTEQTFREHLEATNGSQGTT